MSTKFLLRIKLMCADTVNNYNHYLAFWLLIKIDIQWSIFITTLITFSKKTLKV